MPGATVAASPAAGFTRADLTMFCRLGELGLEVTGQRLEPGRAVLACRVLEPGQWCRRCGCEGLVRDTVIRQLAHEPPGWRPTTLAVTIRRYRCAGCSHVWRIPRRGHPANHQFVDDAPAQPALHRGHPGQEAGSPGRISPRPGRRRPDQGRRPPPHRPRPPTARRLSPHRLNQRQHQGDPAHANKPGHGHQCHADRLSPTRGQHRLPIPDFADERACCHIVR